MGRGGRGLRGAVAPIVRGRPASRLGVPAVAPLPPAIREKMLDFCAAHGLGADVEVVRPDYVNEAYERMLRSDVKYRFVLDMQALGA